jgi:hypothetical protein
MNFPRLEIILLLKRSTFVRRSMKKPLESVSKYLQKYSPGHGLEYSAPVPNILKWLVPKKNNETNAKVDSAIKA